MKQLAFLLILITSTRAQAQNIELGVRGGYSYNTAYTDKGKGRGGFAANIFAAAKVSKLQVGVSLDVVQLKCLTENGATTVHAGEPLKVYNTLGNPAYSLSLFANKVFKAGAIDFYTGLAAGAVFANGETRVVMYNISPPWDIKEGTFKQSGYGFCVGAQAGINYHIAKRVAIAAQVAPKLYYISSKYKEPANVQIGTAVYKKAPFADDTYTPLAVPVTAGIILTL